MAEASPRTVALQAKRYQPGSNVAPVEIREYNSLIPQEDVELAIVVTTSNYTKDAHQKIRELPVRALDGEDLIDPITESNALDLVEQYTAREVGPGQELSTAEQSISELTSMFRSRTTLVTWWRGQRGAMCGCKARGAIEPNSPLRRRASLLVRGWVRQPTHSSVRSPASSSPEVANSSGH
jgi:hypothetical protein